MEGVGRGDIHDPKDDPKEDLIEEDKVFVGKEEGDFHKPREEPKEEDVEVLVVVVVEHRKRGSIDEDTLF
jgi:hypothetical protein